MLIVIGITVFFGLKVQDKEKRGHCGAVSYLAAVAVPERLHRRFTACR
jgi:hypothetical protein